MSIVAGRFKDGDMQIKGEVDERLPFLTDSLVSYFPMDWNAQDRLTEYDNPLIIMTDRDFYATNFSQNYNYSGVTFLISGKVRCIDTIDGTKGLSIGFHYKKTGAVNAWVSAKSWALSSVQDGFVNFIVTYQIPSDYESSLKPWLNINIITGTTGYKVEFRDIHYQVTNNPNIVAQNIIQTDDSIAITEASTNYIENGDFRNGLTNWSPSANATTLNLINSPWGKGVRVQRDNGDGGNWSLKYSKAISKVYAAGDTWVWSFKYRVIKKPGTVNPFSVGWWLSDNGTYVVNLPIINDYDLIDGWKQAHAIYTFVGGGAGPYSGLIAMAFNRFYRYSIVDFADIQLELRNLPTPKIEGTSSDATLSININLSNIGSNYTLTSERRSLYENAFNKDCLIKNGSIFAYLRNGVITTSFNNKWQKVKMKYLTVSRFSGAPTWNISKYTDPIYKSYTSDPIFDSYALNTDNCGYYFKTFVYCSSACQTWQRWIADNAGGIRINNGIPINLGGYDYKTNPDILVSLNLGWNIIEMWYMDGSTGGGLSLQQNSQGKNSNYNTTPSDFVDSIPISQISGVVFMTAELPVEVANDKIFYNEKSNLIVKNIGIYNKAFLDSDIKIMYTSRIPIDISGNFKMQIDETPPCIPSDAIYFPLSYNSKDIYQYIGASDESNTVYCNGMVWVGPRTENLWSTIANKPSPSTDTNGGYINANEIKSCEGSVSWSLYKTGSTSQWHGWKDIFNNVIIGSSGDSFTFSLYTKSVNKAGVDLSSNILRSLVDPTNIKTTLLSDLSLIEDDQWYRKHSIETLNEASTSGIVNSLNWGASTSKGLLYMCAPQWEKRSFLTPFVDGTREKSSLSFNFNRDLSWNWGTDWSIVYFKIPVGSHNGVNTNGYNLESLGCNSNTIGDQFLAFGKDNNSNKYYSSGIDIDTNNYFNNLRMISIIRKGTVITVKEWIFNKGVVTIRTSDSVTALSSNAFVTQYGYDFKLGGWDNVNPCGAWYKDLIVSPVRAFTDDELNNIFNDRFSFKGDTLHLQNKLIENPTLS